VRARIKSLLRSSLHSCGSAFATTRVGRTLLEGLSDGAAGQTLSVLHEGTRLTFAAPNAVSRARAKTFSSKEPETLRWIDTIPTQAVLWDIGANVGLYSCYAAKARGCRVIAFEPSVFNLELLARNVFMNGLTEHVTIVSLPLFERVMESTFNMSSTERGGALSTFAASHGYDGQELHKVFEFRTVGMPVDECVARLQLPPPQFLKMDVDGIEHLILRGATATLRGVTSVSIEINDAFVSQAQECAQLLQAGGLHLASKEHSELIEANASFRATYNQVWNRS
jgi:FkbM family methyltransferase